MSRNAVTPSAASEHLMREDATAALQTDALANLDVEGFEAGKVFALAASILREPPKGLTRRRLLRTLNTIYLFVLHPTAPLDPTNPRSRLDAGKKRATEGGGAFRPAHWFVDVKKTGTIGRGFPPRTVLGRKRAADVVVECSDRDFVDMATGKMHAQQLYLAGRIKIKGDLDRAMRISTLINHERAKLYGDADGTSGGSGATYASDRGLVARPQVGKEVPYDSSKGEVREFDGDVGAGAPAPTFRSKL